MTDYEEIPYPELAHAQSHPDSLATLAALVGLSPAPVERCRVLEIGCAGGGNLIPMALGLPGSSFTGLDYSARQIAEGQAAVAAVGVKNVRLLREDILEVDETLGQFDYIIAHGVYSWVPAPVREKLLAVCSQNLAPDGIAYVSYNTYPGWHMLGALREMMLYHVRDVASPRERATRARGLLQLLADSVPTEGHVRNALLNAYSSFLKREVDRVEPKADAFLLHDELEEINDPVYFYQFMEQAERHGLQFVAEVDFRGALPSFYPAKATQALFQGARSVVEMEQYLDFLRSRMFRQTLLCHAGPAIQRTIQPGRLQALFVASRAVPESDHPEIRAQSVEKFKGLKGAALSIDHPLSKAAMLYLAACWPRVVSFKELLSAAAAYLNGGPAAPAQAPTAEDAHVLAVNLLKAYVYSEDLVEVHAHAPHFTVQVSERPVASAWARWQARAGTKVTNLRHERVELDPLNQYLIGHLDGTRDCAALTGLLLAEPVAGGKLVVEQDDHPVDDVEQMRSIIAGELQANLSWLARAALLTA